MKMGKVKAQIYQKHPKVQVFWDMGKKIELSRLDQQYESVTLIIVYQSPKTRDFNISNRRILNLAKNMWLV